jgi:hypothetical protein
VSGDSGTIEAGRSAWARLRDRERATWSDWLDVARALAIGRTVALQAAGTNSPVGTRYNTAMGTWLRENGLGDVVAQERYRLLLILQNLDAVETWRAGLDDAKRRRLNHPNAIWAHWQRSLKTEIARPRRREVLKGAKAKGNRHAIHWNGDAIRRAACAIREVYSTDFYVMARRALEAAVRNEDDLLELLPPDTVTMSALPQRTDVVSAAGHVG